MLLESLVACGYLVIKQPWSLTYMQLPVDFLQLYLHLKYLSVFHPQFFLHLIHGGSHFLLMLLKLLDSGILQFFVLPQNMYSFSWRFKFCNFTSANSFPSFFTLHSLLMWSTRWFWGMLPFGQSFRQGTGKNVQICQCFLHGDVFIARCLHMLNNSHSHTSGMGKGDPGVFH